MSQNALIPNDYERNNVGEILDSSSGDFFAHLLRLISRADPKNKERLRLVYPHHVACYEAWTRGEIWSPK
jgi:hypothetical protein